MSIKQIGLRIAGQQTIVDLEINEDTTAAEVLAKAECPSEYELFVAVGQPPLKSEERVWDALDDKGKAYALKMADAC